MLCQVSSTRRHTPVADHQNNDLYIFSHPEFREVLTARGNTLLNALPNEPINQVRADAIRWILSNPIYDEGA